MAATVPLSPIVAAVLLAYLSYSVWNAYTTGVNHGMLKRNRIRGVVSYGPYLSLIISFAGIMLVVFILYELAGYYVGFVRADLPFSLARLDFFTFLSNQLRFIKPQYLPYVAFLMVGVVISWTISFIVVRSLYRKGLKKGKG